VFEIDMEHCQNYGGKAFMGSQNDRRIRRPPKRLLLNAR
jgi:hypothetical protein